MVLVLTTTEVLVLMTTALPKTLKNCSLKDNSVPLVLQLESIDNLEKEQIM